MAQNSPSPSLQELNRRVSLILLICHPKKSTRVVIWCLGSRSSSNMHVTWARDVMGSVCPSVMNIYCRLIFWLPELNYSSVAPLIDHPLRVRTTPVAALSLATNLILIWRENVGRSPQKLNRCLNFSGGIHNYHLYSFFVASKWLLWVPWATCYRGWGMIVQILKTQPTADSIRCLSSL